MVKSTIGIFLLLFTASSVFAKQDCFEHMVASSREQAQIYTSRDFELSRLWSGSGQTHYLFAQWASENANWVAERFRDTDIEELFARISSDRFLLAQKMNHGNSRHSQFGRLRTTGAYTWLGSWSDPKTFRSASIHRAFLEALRNKTKISVDRNQLFYQPQPRALDRGWWIYTNTYDTLNLVRVDQVSAASHNVGYPGELYIHHPKTDSMKTIFSDVIDRLRELQQATNLSDSERMGKFTYALFGFFNAMPYARGSSAIGRVVFSGMHLALFGRKLILPDDADVFAMLSDYAEFKAHVENQIGGLFDANNHSKRSY